MIEFYSAGNRILFFEYLSKLIQVLCKFNIIQLLVSTALGLPTANVFMFLLNIPNPHPFPIPRPRPRHHRWQQEISWQAAWNVISPVNDNQQRKTLPRLHITRPGSLLSFEMLKPNTFIVDVHHIYIHPLGNRKRNWSNFTTRLIFHPETHRKLQNINPSFWPCEWRRQEQTSDVCLYILSANGGFYKWKK